MISIAERNGAVMIAPIPGATSARLGLAIRVHKELVLIPVAMYAIERAGLLPSGKSFADRGSLAWRTLTAHQAQFLGRVDPSAWRKEIEIITRCGKWEPAIQIFASQGIDPV
jgi:hypothetical protein